MLSFNVGIILVIFTESNLTQIYALGVFLGIRALIILVAFTERNGNIRIISARPAGRDKVIYNG